MSKFGDRVGAGGICGVRGRVKPHEFDELQYLEDVLPRRAFALGMEYQCFVMWLSMGRWGEFLVCRENFLRVRELCVEFGVSFGLREGDDGSGRDIWVVIGEAELVPLVSVERDGVAVSRPVQSDEDVVLVGDVSRVYKWVVSGAVALLLAMLAWMVVPLVWTGLVRGQVLMRDEVQVGDLERGVVGVVDHVEPWPDLRWGKSWVFVGNGEFGEWRMYVGDGYVVDPEDAPVPIEDVGSRNWGWLQHSAE